MSDEKPTIKDLRQRHRKLQQDVADCPYKLGELIECATLVEPRLEYKYDKETGELVSVLELGAGDGIIIDCSAPPSKLKPMRTAKVIYRAPSGYENTWSVTNRPDQHRPYATVGTVHEFGRSLAWRT